MRRPLSPTNRPHWNHYCHT
uniref:Uncharacterized protein n=1 Tax=Arundo donax TaxID=35708 RepID=A0A0A9HGL4_ARUDO